MKIRTNLAFGYLSKCGFKENVLRGKCQDANVSINLVFDYQSKCMLLKFKHCRPILSEFRRLVDMNLKQHFVYFRKNDN